MENQDFHAFAHIAGADRIAIGIERGDDVGITGNTLVRKA